MGLIQRFTRDGASKFVWAGLGLAAIAALVYAVNAGGRAVDDERAASQDRAVRYVEEVIDPRLDGAALLGPITGQAADPLKDSLRRSILADERVSRVRIWSADGVLLFSTSRADQPGSRAGLNDAILREAARGGPLTRSDFSDTGGQDDPERSLLRTYVPLGGSAVVEIDQTDAGTVALARSEWRSYQILAGAFLLFFLLMTVLSLRDPIEPINAGVPFAASSIPEGYSLIDDDRLHAVHEVYRLASERVARLQEKLNESEEARRRLEGDIQRALSKAAPSAPHVEPAPSAPPSPPPAAPTPEPAVVQVPESEVVSPVLGDAWAAAPAGPLARAARDQKPSPAAKRTPKPAAEKPKRVPKRRQKAKHDEVAKAPSEAPAPPRRVAAVAAARAAATPAPSAPVDPDLADAKAHEAALETFIRLTESDRRPHDTTEVDQGAVRAALARTAARKKPGGERLQPHDEPHGESPGRPPRRS